MVEALLLLLSLPPPHRAQDAPDISDDDVLQHFTHGAPLAAGYFRPFPPRATLSRCQSVQVWGLKDRALMLGMLQLVHSLVSPHNAKVNERGRVERVSKII